MPDTMTRLEALEKVAEAARRVLDIENLGRPITHWHGLHESLRALDSIHTEPAAETVTLAVWEISTGIVSMVVAGSEDDRAMVHYCTRHGTVTLPLDKEPGA